MSPPACLVVTYHYVRDTCRTPFPEIKALAVTDFEAQLDWLQSSHRIIDYPSFVAILNGDQPLTGPTALLTFDDGFVDHYSTVLPILKERRLSGIFFVAGATLGVSPKLLNVHKTHFLLAKLGASAFTAELSLTMAALLDELELDLATRSGIYRYDARQDVDMKRLLNYDLPIEVADLLLEKMFKNHIGDATSFAKELYLSEEMIGEMASAGMTFGWHTVNHHVLSRLSHDEQAKELEEGVKLIAQLTGQESVPFCYPYGHPHTYNVDTLAILAKAGYSMAVTVLRRTVFPESASRYEIPRFDTRDLPPLTERNIHA